VAASVSPAPAPRPLVLVVANDFDPVAARISRHLARALERIGYAAIVRDTRLNRWGAAEAAAAGAARREAFEAAVVAKWAKLVDDYGVDLVLGLDAHWMLSPRLFVQAAERVRQVHSLWLSGSVPSDEAPFGSAARDLLNSPKVTHHGASELLLEKLRAFGLEHLRRTRPAAPRDYLRAADPCTVRDRVAFIGDASSDLAGLAQKLWQRARLDVYGDVESWARLGVEAKPMPPFPQLPALYRRYAAHLGPVNEGLFEVAACGRLPLVPDDAEVRACYDDGEISRASGLNGLEAAVENVLRDPEAALAAGLRARERTAREHLWEHRLAEVLA
jgi:glycosyltransferase involved in cell wall biosynthesis